MNCCEYAVARYSSALVNSGSSFIASWKKSIAFSYLASRKARTPLFRLSRACNFAQLAAASARTSKEPNVNSFFVMAFRASLLRRNLFGHQTNLIDARALSDIDDLHHVVVHQILVAIHEHGAVVARSKNLDEFRSDIPEVIDVLVDFDDLVLVNTDHDDSVEFIRRRRRLARRRRLWNCRIEPLGR